MAPKSQRPGAINRAPTLGDMVRTFKALCTYQIHRFGNTNFAWQRNYYERVIRNEPELLETRQYIHDNPLKWDTDPENMCRLEPQEA